MLALAGRSRRTTAGCSRRTTAGRSRSLIAVPGWGPFALALLVALAAVPVPVSAHVNDVNADPQVSADGTVVIETVFIGTDGWVVLHEVNGSDPGEPIGHAAVSREGGLKTDVRVQVSSTAWQNWSGNRTVWAVLHTDDGDGQFEPSDDDAIEQFGEPAGQQFAVRPGDSSTYVTARGFAPQKTDEGTVTVRTVALAGDGYVVVRNATGSGPGEVVARTAVPEGVNHNVSVELDPAFFRSRRGTFALWSVAYVDDGDGSFDSGDSPVRVGSRAVQTRFGVEKTGGPTATHTTESDSGDNHHGPDIGTATRHAPTPTATATPAGTPGGTLAGDSPTTTGADVPVPVPVPGFGLRATLAGITVAVTVAAAVILVAAGRH